MPTVLATYRLQLGPGCNFRQAADLGDYLTLLGVSHVYASPILQPRPGSEHGYDVVDPGKLNPELGDEADLRRALARLAEHGLGWVQDIVPNHMAFDARNPMLRDVLELGPLSGWVSFFDLDWDHPNQGLRGRLLAPFLGRPYGQCLEDGEMRVELSPAGLQVRYYEHCLPLRPGSYADIGGAILARREVATRGEAPGRQALADLICQARDLEKGCGTPPERAGRAVKLRESFWRLCQEHPRMGEAAQATLAALNGKKGDPASFNGLDALLSDQHFRLARWKVAAEEINYRRFFSLNQYISTRVEEPEVFEARHGYLLDLAARLGFDGLRVDHLDGLYCPLAYLRRLRERAGGLYLVVEKVLQPGEELPGEWPVQGSTGYDFMWAVINLLCSKRHEAALSQVYHRFLTAKPDYPELVRQNKKLMLDREMAGDLDNLTRAAMAVAAGSRHGRDLTFNGLRTALAELLTSLGVYRTYIEDGPPGPRDAALLRNALAQARRQAPDRQLELEFLMRVLRQEPSPNLEAENQEPRLDFARRFQQLTAPLCAKGLEDTTLYAYNRLLALNEVGSDPGRLGLDLEGFHGFLARRAESWPRTLNATATHDTKRGEDARARLAVLSELPELWEENLLRWAGLNRSLKQEVEGDLAPDANDEYFLYQTLLSSWPFDPEDRRTFGQRLEGYLVKAVRESKRHSDWLEHNQAYEEACLAFLRAILAPGHGFWADFLAFQQRLAAWGVWASLSQTAIKLAAPGVPDLYQGTELWDFSLGDPDNRRPVDFARRRALLRQVAGRREEPRYLAGLLATPRDGRVKLLLSHRMLQARQAWPKVFVGGLYLPLATSGKRARHLVAFAREAEGQWAVLLAPRHLTGIIAPGEAPVGRDCWEDTWFDLPRTPGDRWVEWMTSRELSSEEARTASLALGNFPVALLLSSPGR
ncbi:MAG: malto-oligosyltrehalose synthase [Deltaproteobacteria bacterium]|nr:malto-oligosyltrehalose synthase [Deltaproteobacteria bacterium]